ncbi:hypothetical protein QFZ82_007150 [Streptomyces sp. V4I23]|uniref:hypothetical protein n=1 Tax=Streptomyces sp. V4I23 TaxID=3042282 RepID=UPI00277EFF28|nr:hypothetical protein [Streptomyces sp. V4I23]MDQ1012665.1 hypothetical protein [Streptomyces sp. V4I23]
MRSAYPGRPAAHDGVAGRRGRQPVLRVAALRADADVCGPAVARRALCGGVAGA